MAAVVIVPYIKIPRKTLIYTIHESNISLSPSHFISSLSCTHVLLKQDSMRFLMLSTAWIARTIITLTLNRPQDNQEILI